MREACTGALFTDHYQLTMAQLYRREGLDQRRVRFDHFYRNNPDYGTHQAGFCIAAGLGTLREWLARAQFGPTEREALGALRSPAGEPVFTADFLSALGALDFGELTLRAVPEGRVVHPHEPMTVVEGPLMAAQLLETALLATLNYQSLIATRAARIREAGRSQLLLDFGMRRGQGFGANAGSRAALIGGADFSSNVGVSLSMGLAPRGTHAHSLVQMVMASGGTELDAFRAYARSYPDQCLLLVDTVDTLGSGVPNAIRVFEELRVRGHRPLGVRLDSGDLAWLSIQVALQLDRAGFHEAGIALSNNLDELAIWQIVTQIQAEAPGHGLDPSQLINRLSFGVGTRLMTSEGAPSLGGVYKLVAVEREGQWRPAMKLSETAAKTPTPGRVEVLRLYDDRGAATADVLVDVDEQWSPGRDNALYHPTSPGVSRQLAAGSVVETESLLEPVPAGDEPEPLSVMRARRDADLARLHPGVRRLVNPHRYHVSLSDTVYRHKQALIEELRAGGDRDEPIA